MQALSSASLAVVRVRWPHETKSQTWQQTWKVRVALVVKRVQGDVRLLWNRVERSECSCHWLRVVLLSVLYKAIGEAEAELAYLNASGFIDAIVTDDVDAFLFGAKRVIRK